MDHSGNTTPAFDYPPAVPEWLESWPSSREIAALFAEGVRRLAPRIVRQGAPRWIRWSANALTMEVGRQRPFWRLAAGQWQIGCSCGYPGGKCPHAYAAAEIFDQIARKEGWLASSGEVPAAPAERVASCRRVSAASGRRAEVQGDLFAWAETPRQTAPRTLQVEVDFNCEPGRVGIRFYQFADNRRTLLKMQHLHNLALAARHGSAERDGWPEADRNFLGWLNGQALSRQVLRANLNLLKIPGDEFARWQSRWRECPERFIERATQQAVRLGGGTASAHIELNRVAEGIEIALIVTTPSGKPLRFHELASQLAAGGGKFLLDGQPFSVDFPVSAELLTDAFSQRSPVVPADKICANLPSLIQNRLDLVRGDAVTRLEEEKPVVLAASPDGGDIVIAINLGGEPIADDAHCRPAGISRRGDGGQFVVSIHTSPALPAAREFVARLGASHVGKGLYRLPGKIANIRNFAGLWETPPAGIVCQTSPDLQGLFGKGQALHPVFGGAGAERFVDLNVVWLDQRGRSALSAHEVFEARRHGADIVRSKGGSWLKLDLPALGESVDQLQQFGFDQFGCSRMLAPEADRFFAAAGRVPAWALAPDTRDLAKRVARQCEVAVPTVAERMRQILRHYQLEGAEFLLDRTAHRVGAILADDMGLGKTVQVLALLTAAAAANGGRLASEGRLGALVVCPASVVGVWVCEVRKFSPELRCQVYSGLPAERGALLAAGAGDWDILVTNYSLLRNDIEHFARHEFAYAILDEAQQIKNPEALVTQAVKRLKTLRPLALTGTPVENRVADLWSIMDFLNPGFLGPVDDFKLKYDTPNARRTLSRRLAPVIMRRTKELVAPELPPKTEEIMVVDMGPAQREFYSRQLKSARAAAAGGGMLALFAALTRLRQVCCDPRLVDAELGDTVGSAKLDALMEMAEEILAEGHSILVFSQFTSMLALIEKRLKHADMAYRKITGATPAAERPRIVAEFNAQTQPEIFLLSLKAAGTGLTLTKADYVFLYDPWWNPAVENQAIDRTHRIGQDKPVFAYRLIAQGSVEEKVLALQQEKAELFAQIMGDAETMSLPKGLTSADLESLLA